VLADLNASGALCGPNTRTGKPLSRIVSAIQLKSPSQDMMQNASLRSRLSSVVASITSAMSAAFLPAVLRKISIGQMPRSRNRCRSLRRPEPYARLHMGFRHGARYSKIERMAAPLLQVSKSMNTASLVGTECSWLLCSVWGFS